MKNLDLDKTIFGPGMCLFLDNDEKVLAGSRFFRKTSSRFFMKKYENWVSQEKEFLCSI